MLQAQKTTKPRRHHVWVQKDEREFILEIFITDGPMTEAFVKNNPEVSRKIELRGDDTLDMLHYAIFDAFNRYDPHMYEFRVGGKGPMDEDTRRYVLPSMMEDRNKEKIEEFGIAGNVENTTIGSLNLKEDDAFGYWFDYGDDWWHQINVVSIQSKVKANKKYPRIASRIGKSPPQYAKF